MTFAVEESPYLLIGFEDFYNGGDLDYNDLLFVLEVGEQNVQTLIANNPEPSTVFLLGSFMFYILYLHQKDKLPLAVNLPRSAW
ncbi:MAG: DUF4114 domain-containing protein [Candidatus Lindowbacteria bacterium]|nr:DUF4114 domain-containing protein [Candidatus Lindowbacteria bacterium]